MKLKAVLLKEDTSLALNFLCLIGFTVLYIAIISLFEICSSNSWPFSPLQKWTVNKMGLLTQQSG